jgi:nitrogen fixation/metabolism regulation signal transduction histidine kinase
MATTDAQSMPKSGQGPKRRLRNYLLDARFQLKYTGMVIAVTVLVTSAVGYWLGSEAYAYSRESSDVLTTQAAGVSPELFDFLQRQSEEKDAEVLQQIVIGVSSLVVILAIALGLTGIVVTHRVVGPAYKLKLLFGDVAKGSLNVRGGLRKGDELQDVGDAFKAMVTALRERREDEIAELERTLTTAREAGMHEAVLADLEAFRDRLRTTLED